MEQDLNKYIVNEFCKLQTDTEQRSFIENFRFLMMSNDFDFENYYSNKALRRWTQCIYSLSTGIKKMQLYQGFSPCSL